MDTNKHKYNSTIFPNWEKWLRNKNTIEFLGIWKQMYNSDFNSPEFEGINNSNYSELQ